jgi:hypothetical protein
MSLMVRWRHFSFSVEPFPDRIAFRRRKMHKFFNVRLSLWHRILILLLLPVLIAAGIVFFEFRNLTTIYKKIHIIEIIDDINLTILEIRRYEKNIQLFNEEQNVKMFNEHFDVLKKSIQKMEPEIISDMSKIEHRSLQKNIDFYDKHVGDLISSIKEEHRIIEDIRPLGRAIENFALIKRRRLTCDDMRRTLSFTRSRLPSATYTAYRKISSRRSPC